MRAGGATAKDKVHVAYGYGLFTGGLGAHYGAERLGATVIPMSGGQTERQAQLILDFKPDIIMVTPSYCLTLIDELERKMGGDARGCSLRLGVFGAEPWTEALRHEIETRMGIKALDIYGLSEVMGPGVAMECLESGGGPTIWEDHFLPEIICPETGIALPDGEHGELVFTTLTKEALPVIRYRTRDLTRLLPGDARQMRRMGKITGSLRAFARRAGDSGEASLSQAVDAAVMLLHPRLQRTSMTIHRDYLHPEQADVRLAIEQIRLEQILVNLISNALDAMRNQVDRQLWLSGTADADGYQLEVRDNGPGIAPETRAHLFEPFFTTKPGEQGLGLGLTLSASLAAAAGGSLTVRHPDEGGTAFILSLPYPREPKA